ncbi:hypothetical protein [Flavobacterium hungaricum]|uniref:Uncharacterized protein n=1 Tax=Flavobacterium hungaricum TaxID=2082725 RepID=A0ABR9TPK6_9FLAO|nr:hypothetical protein [Flavobacterium hungaricum]MBE8727307.1 hypothetical protein [Flavobacterium hungaricum]
MKNHLKYLITLFLAFAVIAGDGTLNFQSKSAEFYQSSNVIVNRELDFATLRLYRFSFSKSFGKSSFSIFIIYKSVKEVLSLQIKVLLLFCESLHQKINSFVKQAVFVNEIIHSRNFRKSLYTA